MQLTFDLGAVEDLTWVRDQLRTHFGRLEVLVPRAPINQLVRSLLSSRTLDETSLGAYRRIVEAYPQWSDLAAAPVGDVQAVISDVTFPDVKAHRLCDAMNIIVAQQPGFDLTFLKSLGIVPALAWLERLPGVARKVSASTLNFSTLDMAAFVVDGHILRVVSRYGFIRRTADALKAYETVMAIAYRWTAADFRELHRLIKLLGQTVCQHGRADCRNCPLSARCRQALVTDSSARLVA